MACAASSMFWRAQPSEIQRSGVGISVSASSSRATASSSKGARWALSCALSTWSGKAAGSRSSKAPAKTSASSSRLAMGTPMNRHGRRCSWSGAAAAASNRSWSCASSGPGAIRRLGSTVCRVWISVSAQPAGSSHAEGLGGVFWSAIEGMRHWEGRARERPALVRGVGAQGAASGTTVRLRMPWAPWISTPSMSAVAEGPVMKMA